MFTCQIHNSEKGVNLLLFKKKKGIFNITSVEDAFNLMPRNDNEMILRGEQLPMDGYYRAVCATRLLDGQEEN